LRHTAWIKSGKVITRKWQDLISEDFIDPRSFGSRPDWGRT
jgi:hypothetical protein